MKKQKRNFIIEAVALLVLCLIVIFLRMPQGEGSGKEGADQDTDGGIDAREEKPLFAKTDGVERILVEMPQEDLVIVCGGDFGIQDFPEGKLDHEKVKDTAEGLMQSMLTETLGHQEDLEQFGLGEEAVAVRVEYKDGDNTELLVGNGLEGSGGRHYVLYGDEVSVAEGIPQELFAGRKAFYNMTLLSVPYPEGESERKLEYLHLEGSSFPEPVSIVASDKTASGYLMEAPVYAEAMFSEAEEGTQDVPLLDSLSMLEAQKVAQEDADREKRRQYGLEEPLAIAEYSIDGEKHKILAGKPAEDGMRPLMVDEDPNIYLVDESQVNAWAGTDVMRLRSSYIWLVDVKQLADLTFIRKEDTVRFTLEWDQPDDDTQDLKIWCQGEQVETDGWLAFYQKLLGMTVMNSDRSEKFSEEAEFRVVYTLRKEKGEETVNVEFYRTLEEGRYAAFLDQKFAGIIRKSTVEEVMGMLDRMMEDEENS